MRPDPLRDPLILAPPPAVDEAGLGRALVALWGLEGTLRPLGGERDRNFRLDRPEAPPLLVRLAHPDEPPAVTDFQVAAMLHLEAADPDLPVQRVVRARDGAPALPHPAADGRPCLLRVLTYLPGRPLPEDPGADGPAVAAALGRLAARLDRALEGFAHPADGRRLLWDIREAPGLRGLLPEVADAGLRALTGAALDRAEGGPLAALAALPAQVIHNDLNPHNVMADGTGAPAGVIDFGDMVRAPRLQEVATACAYLVRPGEDPLLGPTAFVAGYRGVLGLPEEQAAMLPALAAARMALTVLIAHWRARRQPGNAPYILRNMPGARAGLEALARGAAAFGDRARCPTAHPPARR